MLLKIASYPERHRQQHSRVHSPFYTNCHVNTHIVFMELQLKRRGGTPGTLKGQQPGRWLPVGPPERPPLA